MFGRNNNQNNASRSQNLGNRGQGNKGQFRGGNQQRSAYGKGSEGEDDYNYSYKHQHFADDQGSDLDQNESSDEQTHHFDRSQNFGGNSGLRSYNRGDNQSFRNQNQGTEWSGNQSRGQNYSQEGYGAQDRDYSASERGRNPNNYPFNQGQDYSEDSPYVSQLNYGRNSGRLGANQNRPFNSEYNSRSNSTGGSTGAYSPVGMDASSNNLGYRGNQQPSGQSYPKATQNYSSVGYGNSGANTSIYGYGSSGSNIGNNTNRYAANQATSQSQGQTFGQHAGKGPKGYRRSDDRIKEEASDRLTHDEHIDASEIEVTVENGVITLSGTVEDRQTKRLAEDCVEGIYGASDVKNDIKVESKTETQKTSASTADQNMSKTNKTTGSSSGKSLM